MEHGDARQPRSRARTGGLDHDHFDLDKVKDRILEFLAVAKLKQDVSGQILCFVGPPGVGKTSLGQSIARALGRKFVASRSAACATKPRSAVTGARTSAPCPATIIRALRDAESRNPVFMIDEIDKLGADFRGDPSSALLEVLDPEQNDELPRPLPRPPFDLSRVLFLCTANHAETIPAPLLDRMDVIDLSGYTEEEKVEIAKRYLVPKQLAAHGLDGQPCRIPRGSAPTSSLASTRARRGYATSSDARRHRA